MNVIHVKKIVIRILDDQAFYAADGHILAVEIMEWHIVQCDEYIMAS